MKDGFVKKRLFFCEKGFSMVELVVVIAIMSVLVGVLVPQFVRYIESTKASTDMQNLQRIKSCVETYYTDNGVDDSHDFELSALGQIITITSEDKDAIFENVSVDELKTLKSSKWSDISMVFTPNTNKWEISGINSVNSDRYNLSYLTQIEE